MNISFVLLTIIAAVLASFIMVNWVYFKILKIAKDKGLVDNPDARKLQKEPIPVMGGIAVFIGAIVGVFAGAVVHKIGGTPVTSTLLPIVCSMMVMLYTGAMDDIIGLTPKSRLVIECLVMLGLIYGSGHCIDTFHGMWGIHQFSWWIAVPLTVFAGVGIINAINMIDGVNGLSSGLCITCSCLFGVAFLKSGDIANATLAFAMASALLPFLAHNVFGLKSRMFIGDAGTMVLGVVMIWFTISMLSSKSPVVYYEAATGINVIAFALAILSVPVFDTIRVMTMRIMKKKSPFHPDKTHLHHVFVNIGISHSITSLSEILIGVMMVGIWALSVEFGASVNMQLYVVIVAAMILVWGMYAILRYHVKHHTKFLHMLAKFSIKTHLGRTDWWKTLTAWLDEPEERLKTKMLTATPEMPYATVRKFDLSDPYNQKELDRKKIIDFMKGKAEVFVEDIKRNSGADAMRVYPILFEEVQEGYVAIVKADSWGAPVIVCLTGKA